MTDPLVPHSKVQTSNIVDVEKLLAPSTMQNAYYAPPSERCMDEAAPKGTRVENSRELLASSLDRAKLRRLVDKKKQNDLAAQNIPKASVASETPPLARQYLKAGANADQTLTQEHFLGATQEASFIRPIPKSDVSATTKNDGGHAKSGQPLTGVRPTQVHVGKRYREMDGIGVYNSTPRSSIARPKSAAKARKGPDVERPEKLSELDRENQHLAIESKKILDSIPRERLGAPSEDISAWRGDIGSGEPDLLDMPLFPGLEMIELGESGSVDSVGGDSVAEKETATILENEKHDSGNEGSTSPMEQPDLRQHARKRRKV